MLFPRDERVTILGQTGSGKTYFAKAALAWHPRLIVCDAKGYIDENEWNLTDFDSDKGLIETGKGTAAKPVRLRVRPQLDISDWDEVFRWIYNQTNLTVYIDEVAESTTFTGTRAFRALLMRGREKGINVWCSTQRPKGIPKTTISEAGVLVIFRLQIFDDRKFLADNGAGPMALMKLEDHQLIIRPPEGPDAAVWYPKITPLEVPRQRVKELVK